MRLKLSGKFLPIVIAWVLLMGMVPLVAAYEAHTINVTAHVEVGATRTVGFWKTHVFYTSHVLSVHLSGNTGISWRGIGISSIEEVMGIFWANTSMNSDNTTRSELCKARLKTSRQALAAILSSALDNGAPVPVTIVYIQDTLLDDDIPAIIALGAFLDIHNNTYHNVPIQDETGIGNADPEWAQTLAIVYPTFADCPLSWINTAGRGGQT